PRQVLSPNGERPTAANGGGRHVAAVHGGRRQGVAGDGTAGITMRGGQRILEPRTPAWRRYLRFWRSDPDADVADELRFHLESAVAEYIAAGMTPQAARTEAIRRFGDIDAIASTLHTLSHERERVMEWRDRLDTLRSDLRFAIRQLRK